MLYVNSVQKLVYLKLTQQLIVKCLISSVREDLQPKAPLAMAILNPLKLVITNYPEGQTEMIELENNAKDETKRN